MKIKGSTVDLAKRIVELESQCDQLNEEKMKLMEQVVKGKCKEEHMKDKYVKVKLKYGDMKDKLDSEEMKWREEDDKIREERRQLKVQNRKLEIDLNAAVSKRTGVDDTAKKRRVTEADAECLKSLLEERDGRITNLIGKNEVLERQNSRLEREKQKLVEQKNLELNQKVQVFEREKEQMRALEAKNHKLGEQIIWELNQKIRVFEREKEETVAEVSKLQKEKSDEAERNLNLSTTIEVEKKRLKEVEGKTFELLKRIGALERAKKARQENVYKLNREKNEKVKEILNEKMAFEEETNKMIVELSNKIKSLEEQKRETEAKVSQANMEKNEATERFSKEKIAAEAEKRVLEEENKKMVVVLTNGNEALKKEQKEMEAKFSRAIMEKNVEIERTFKEADAEKRALGEEHKKMVLVLTKRIEALGVEKREMETKYSKAKTYKNAEIQRILNEKVTAQAEKRAFEEESKKEVLVLVKRIESLEEEERGMEAEVHRATMEKIAAEAEKRALEEESKKMVAVLTKRNESLEEEKRETEAKFSRAYKERNTEMERILKEKMALKEKGEKMSSERDEVIQVLQQDIETLEARNKELERENIRLVLKREEDEELYHEAQGSNLVGILGSGSAAAENHGRILDETSKKMSMRWIEARQEEEMEARKEAAPAQWKRRAWNTFVQYLRNRDLTPELCSGAHVVEFLNNLNQFGKSKAHVSACPCPLRQAWFSNGCLVSSLHAAFEENGGRPDSNPFAAHSVTSYLRELREAQSKARGAP